MKVKSLRPLALLMAVVTHTFLKLEEAVWNPS